MQFANTQNKTHFVFYLQTELNFTIYVFYVFYVNKIWSDLRSLSAVRPSATQLALTHS